MMSHSAPAVRSENHISLSTHEGGKSRGRICNLIDRLFEELNFGGISYCQWKGNYALEHVLSGEKDDVDLLVDRRCFRQVVTILLNLGYKQAGVKWESELPGVFHYYAFDEQIDQLVHIHLFLSNFTGEDFVNSHWLPFESMLLENVGTIGKVHVPTKPAELVSFVLKVLIRYGSLPDLMYQIGELEKIEDEMRWLLADTDLSEALRLVKKYCPAIGEDLFMTSVNVLSSKTSLFRRMWVARQVRRQLRVYSRSGCLQRLLDYTRLLWGQGQRLFAANRQNKQLCTGGAVVAFVGPEATGKSTLVSECGQWLGTTFAVRTVHAGKPPSSWLTMPANRLMPLLRRLLPKWRTTRLEGHGVSVGQTGSGAQVKGLSSLLYKFRAVMVAWDRRRLLVKARRWAAQGTIVICDRYPSEVIGAMDSPRLRESPTKGRILQGIHNGLARLEAQLYSQIPPPDITFRLTVSVSTAKHRNRERIKIDKESDAYLESRHRQNQEWQKAGTRYIYDIATERPLAETILTVKRAIWEIL